MDRLELREIASIHGPVAGPAKTDLLQGTDVFLHTSRYEGHPMAVLEALSFGIPCLLTPNTNVAEEVAAAGAGWEVALSPEAIAQGILTVLRCPPAALEEAGARARELVLRQYTWEKIASQTLDAYRRFAA